MIYFRAGRIDYCLALRQGGRLAINIANGDLNLEPLIKAVCIEFNCPVVGIYQPLDLSRLRLSSYWAFFVKNPSGDFVIPPGAGTLDFDLVSDFTLPTDEKGSFLGLVRWPWSE